MEITGKVMMTLKIFTEETISGQKELEVEVGNFDNTVSMLKLLGFREKAYQETKRELWRLNDVEIMIDEWPFLEPFIEIEGANEEAVRAIAEKLGFDYSEAIFGPVTIQYSQKYNLEEDLINNKTPKIIFDMENPFVRPNATA